MSSQDLPFVLFFVSSVLVLFSGYNYFTRERVARKAANRRLALLDTHESATTTLDLLRRERGILSGSRWPVVQKAQDWLLQSGLGLTRTRMIAALLGFCLFVTGGAILAFDFNPLALPAGLGGSILIVFLFVRYMRNRRIAQFSQQLPEVLEMVVRSLRSGHPLPAALSLVARETRDPAGSEFGMVFDEISYGLGVPTAIKNMSQRVGDPDLLYVVTSISVQAESGGNLAEILERLSKTIRERQKLRLKIGAMTAEGRTSGLVLTALPFVVTGVVLWVSPSYFGDVEDSPTFIWMMKLAGGLLIAGHFIIRGMVNFKY